MLSVLLAVTVQGYSQGLPSPFDTADEDSFIAAMKQGTGVATCSERQGCLHAQHAPQLFLPSTGYTHNAQKPVFLGNNVVLGVQQAPGFQGVCSLRCRAYIHSKAAAAAHANLIAAQRQHGKHQVLQTGSTIVVSDFGYSAYFTSSNHS